MSVFLKRSNLLLLVVFVMTVILFIPQTANAEVDLTAGAAIVVDVDSGKILYAKNEDEQLPPASMTKMMTEYIVLEKINNGDINWEDEIEISDFVFDISANTSFSGIGLRKNVQYTVKDLYEAMAINSDNATTIALAELIAGSEGEFVKLMNEKGEELGLKDFKFVNSTGLDNSSLAGRHPEGTGENDTNLLSPRATAMLAYRLITDYPEVLEVSSIPEKEFERELIRNYNWMLPHNTTYLDQFYYEGVDGLKTGHTSLANYNFTGTAQQNGQRLITVVMQAESEAVRFQETAKLLDFGFNNFRKEELFPSGYKVEKESTIPVAKGKQDTVDIALEDSISMVIRDGSEEEYDVQFELDDSKFEDGELIAPIEKGEKIGTAHIVYTGDKKDYGYLVEGKENVSVNLVTTNEVEKKNWFSLMFSAIGDFFKNLF